MKKQLTAMDKERKRLIKPFQNKVLKQGLLALATIVLMVVLVFAMTTAWYTNVAKTGSLIFQASQWGFSGEINITDQTIAAMPGSSGIVPIEVTNDSDAGALVTITAAKGAMEPELQRRIYFYADCSEKINGEIVEKKYLTVTEGYNYTLLSQGQLKISETYYNDVPIRWEWVYDMLGYYAQVARNGDDTLTVKQYLRPVVYNYDDATFDSKDGRLLTVDGTKTTEEFLAELSKTDGYAEDIDIENEIGGYYPVDVDDEGNGVWVYLCTFSEIERGIDYDTALGNGEIEVQFEASLNVSAQNVPLSTREVSDGVALQNALDSGTDIVRMETDIALEAPLSIAAGQQVVLDLNGYTITANHNNNIITANTGSNIVLLDGNIEGTGENGQWAVCSIGSQVVMSNMSVEGCAGAVVVMDNKGAADSIVRIKDSAFNTTQTAVLIQGNGPKSAGVTHLVVEDCTINSGYVGIAGQGSASGSNQFWGTDMQIINCTINGYWAGIYHPQQNSTMTIYGCDIEGYTGIAVKGGTVIIRDSEVRGIGAAGEPGVAAGGWTDTGDGVYVEATYDWPANVEIQGGCNIISNHRKAVELFEEPGKGPGSLIVGEGSAFYPALETP